MHIEILRTEDKFSSRREAGVLYQDRDGDVVFEAVTGQVVCLDKVNGRAIVFESWHEFETEYGHGPIRRFEGCVTLTDD